MIGASTNATATDRTLRDAPKEPPKAIVAFKDLCIEAPGRRLIDLFGAATTRHLVYRVNDLG